ncbi:hypothetical protein C9374_003226 [Naegleria lovaniensis]|uniref:Endonuclease/exonuclease/phosphatase domain-containing protein n=1 Tax=Naegleria lovaniensis TaxID=51637 RepID=A0AA88GNT7_NAELO|nr:uncharacterized protein C9374_003226 [Naegleria lovaniensis]KAG2386077.1 hypothetical protein C9374_003226 [Naegleria lovaniensis]
MPLCKHDTFCAFTNDPDHKNQYLHTCKYGEQCRSLHNAKHTEWFIHPCPFQDKCSLSNDVKHNLTFTHPEKPTFVAQLFKLVFDHDSGNGTLKLRCPHWGQCSLTNKVEHTTQFYHPCRYGDECRKYNDEAHCEDFFHPCKYGSKCTNQDPYHRFSCLHEDRSPVWMDCHNPTKPHVAQKPKNNGNSVSNSNSNSKSKTHTSTSNTASSGTSHGQYHSLAVNTSGEHVHHSGSLNMGHSISSTTTRHPYHSQYSNTSVPHNQQTSVHGITSSSYSNVAVSSPFNNSMYPPLSSMGGSATSPIPYHSQTPTFPNQQHFPQQQPHDTCNHQQGGQNNMYMSNNANYGMLTSNDGIPQPVIPPLIVMSYNVLADCYVSAERYSHIANINHLKWSNRKQKIFQALKDRPFDIIGLQEVDQSHKNDFADFATNNGYSIFISDKLPRKKDSVAIMFKINRFGQAIGSGGERIIEGYPEVFQYVVLRDLLSNSYLIVMNCHLTFQQDTITPRENQVKRMAEVLHSLHSQVSQQYATNRVSLILVGDFNTQPHETPVKFMESLNLKRAHQDRTGFWTFSTTYTKVCDYIMYFGNLKVTSSDPEPIFLPKSTIPNDEFGSDHIPITATFQMFN